MNWEAIGAIGEVVGAIAVIATLAYLARQIGQGSKSLQSAARFESGRFWSEETIRAALNPDIARIVSIGLVDPKNLNDEERERLVWWFTQHFLFKDALYQQFSDGILPSTTWAPHENMIRGMLQYDSFQRCWDAGVIPVTEGFHSYVEGLRKEPKPNGWTYDANARIFD